MRIGRVHHDVGGTSVLVLIENLVEGFTAIEGAEHAAFGVGSVGMALDCDKNPIRILGIHNDGGDLLCVAQAKVRPGLSSIGRLVKAVADCEIRALEAFATADI